MQSVFLVWYDKVWHDGLLYKLKQNGINGDLLKLIESFLLDRYQRVPLFQKNLGPVLDSKLNFDMHLKKNSVVNNGIALLR